MTHLRQIMLEELRRRNYAESTIQIYIQTVEHFSRHFHRSPDQLGPERIRQYQAALFTRWKLASHPISQQQTPPRPRCPFTRCGNVHCAAEPCGLSNASPPRNSSCDLRLISAGAPLESTFPASNLARASARTLVLCLAFVRMQYGGAIQTL